MNSTNAAYLRMREELLRSLCFQIGARSGDPILDLMLGIEMQFNRSESSLVIMAQRF